MMHFTQVMGSTVEGELVPFPPAPRALGEPGRIRLTPEGMLPLWTKTHSKRKFVNFSQNGRVNIMFPDLMLGPSNIFSPGSDPGMGVYTNEDLEALSIVTEYGGFEKSLAEVVVMRRNYEHTHVIPIVRDVNYLDSRKVDRDVRADAKIPSIRCYLEGHYLGGLLNSAFLKVIIIELN
jgi:hypothetical protein